MQSLTLSTAKLCADAAARGRKVIPDAHGSKSGAALLALAGMRDPRETADAVLKKDGPKGISTFYGFYVLQALAESGDIDTALNFIRTCAAREEGYSWRLRRILSRRFPPQPLPRLGERPHRMAQPECPWHPATRAGVQTCSHHTALGDLKWAEGTYPTPLGPKRVRHERRPDGTIHSDIKAPPGIQVETAGR